MLAILNPDTVEFENLVVYHARIQKVLPEWSNFFWQGERGSK